MVAVGSRSLGRGGMGKELGRRVWGWEGGSSQG